MPALKLNPEVQERICQMVAQGVPLETAARAGGVTYQTLHNWMKRGADGDAPYASFRTEVEQAKAISEANLIALMRQAAVEGSAGEWRAAAWLLARRFPERWSEKRQLEVTGPEQTSTQMVQGMFAQVQAHLGLTEAEEEAEGEQ